MEPDPMSFWVSFRDGRVVQGFIGIDGRGSELSDRKWERVPRERLVFEVKWGPTAKGTVMRGLQVSLNSCERSSKWLYLLTVRCICPEAVHFSWPMPVVATRAFSLLRSNFHRSHCRPIDRLSNVTYTCKKPCRLYCPVPCRA